MIKKLLNNYVGKRVEIAFTDGDILRRTLCHGMVLPTLYYNNDESYYNLPEVRNLTFRAYQVKEIKEIGK